MEESVISCGKTIIVQNCIDILHQENFNKTMLLYKPRALISSSSTVIFKYNDKNIYPLLLESFDEVTKLRMDQVVEITEMATGNCVLLLDLINTNQPCEQNYTLIKPLPVAKVESEPLTIMLTKEEDTLTTQFKAPICVGPLKLQRQDVNRFLHDEFTDINIDAFFETMKSQDSIAIPGTWYHAVLSSENVVKPDKSRSWYDTDCVFIPANINNNHWILLVILPKQTQLLYLDPLANPPQPDILLKLCRYLNIQYLLESFSQLQTIWTVENVMETGEFPSQTDFSSCGAIVCLYAKLIQEKTHLKESHVTPLQIRQYILNEIIKTYQKQTEDNLQFGLQNIIFTKDLDEIIHAIVTGKRLCNEPHSSFLKNPKRMKSKDLIGFGDNYLTQDEFYSIQLYLQDTYFKSVAVPLRLPYLQSIFEDAEDLNNKLKQNCAYGSWYVDCVLVKEVIAEVLGRQYNIPIVEMKRLCSKTEFPCSETVKEEIRGIREARKKMKVTFQ